MAVMSESFHQVGNVTTDKPGVTFYPVSTGNPVEKDATVYLFRFSEPTNVNMEYNGTFAIAVDLVGFKNVSVKTTYPFDRVLKDIANECRRIAVAFKPYV